MIRVKNTPKNGQKYVFCVCITVQTVSYIRIITDLTSSREKFIAKVSDYPQAEYRDAWQQLPDLTGSGDATLSACQTSKSFQIVQISCYLFTSFSLAVKHVYSAYLHWQKDPGFRNQVPEENFLPHFLLGEQDQRLGEEQDQLPCGPTGTSSGSCREMEMHMVRACHTPQQPLQTSFKPPWSVGKAMVGRDVGWSTSKSGHPCPYQNCTRWPPAEKTEGGSLLNRASRPSDDSIIRGTQANWLVERKWFWAVGRRRRGVSHLRELIGLSQSVTQNLATR